MLLDANVEIAYFRIGLIIKAISTIIFTIIPIIIIIKSIIDITKVVGKPDEARNTLNTIIRRIVAGLIVFIIPSFINSIFTLLIDYDNSKFMKYYQESSVEKIKELQQLAKQEEIDRKNKTNAEMKEATAEKIANDQKIKESFEEMRKEDENNTSSDDNYDTTPVIDTTSGSGTYGGLRVENGVFYIPNQRATSDNDTPKQSGKYGVNPIFWERLEKLINDASAQGYSITITSGWRPYSKQRELWDNSSRPCSERSRWVACPGGSRHGFGIAADLKFNGKSCDQNSWDCNQAAKWVHNNAAKYGLKFRMSWEPWHIEPDKVEGGSFGSCKASC